MLEMNIPEIVFWVFLVMLIIEICRRKK